MQKLYICEQATQHHTATHSLSLDGMEIRNGKVKVKELMDNLLGKAKDVCEKSKTKEFIE